MCKEPAGKTSGLFGRVDFRYKCLQASGYSDYMIEYHDVYQ